MTVDRTAVVYTPAGSRHGGGAAGLGLRLANTRPSAPGTLPSRPAPLSRARQAKARREDTPIHEQRLLQWLSAFNMHYSREYAILEMTWPLLAGMRSLTSRGSAKGYALKPRPGLDLVQSQKDVDRSFWARSFCPDQCANQVSQTPSTPSTRRLVNDVAARVSRHSI